MKPLNMRSLLLAGALTCAGATACVAQTYQGYWVVGNGADHTCQIVTSNPVIEYSPGSFGSGPYQSRDDARLARSTISVCPKENPAWAGHQMMPDRSAFGEPDD
jgi:heme A synthase